MICIYYNHLSFTISIPSDNQELEPPPLRASPGGMPRASVLRGNFYGHRCCNPSTRFPNLCFSIQHIRGISRIEVEMGEYRCSRETHLLKDDVFAHTQVDRSREAPSREDPTEALWRDLGFKSDLTYSKPPWIATGQLRAIAAIGDICHNYAYIYIYTHISNRIN